MSLLQQAKAGVSYAETLLKAGVDGGRSAWTAPLGGKALLPPLSESVRLAIGPIALGACIGALTRYIGDSHAPVPKVLAYAFFGAAVGCGAGIVWRGRRSLASVASGARKSMGRVRDEHWLEEHPIDYA